MLASPYLDDGDGGHRDFACFGGFLVLVIERGKDFLLEIREGGPRAAR